MSKVKIVTDSTVDVPLHVLQQHGVEVVPLTVMIDEQLYYDGQTITASEFIRKMAGAKELPKTSQPSAGAFVQVYDRLADEGYEDIISIHMTTGMSGTANAAQNAAELSKANVTVVDSRFLSFGLSFQVIEAAKMVEEGQSIAAILARLTEIRNNSYLYIMVDTLENLVKGGRIGRGTALIGSLLSIKPILNMPDGVLSPLAKVRSHAQMVKFIAKQFVDDTLGKTVKAIGIAHAEAPELAEKVKQALFEHTPFRDVQVVVTTPVISTHAGPGAISIMYHAE